MSVQTLHPQRFDEGVVLAQTPAPGLAIGAVANEVLLQFLVEAVTLSCLGGLAGLLLAQVAIAGLSRLMSLDWSFNPAINALAFGFSAIIGIVFGFVPARRAAGLDPIDALRHE